MQNIILEQKGMVEFEYIFNMFNQAPSPIHDPRNFIYFLNVKKYDIFESEIKLYTDKTPAFNFFVSSGANLIQSLVKGLKSIKHSSV